jgi:hypothetical protein
MPRALATPPPSTAARPTPCRRRPACAVVALAALVGLAGPRAARADGEGPSDWPAASPPAVEGEAPSVAAARPVAVAAPNLRLGVAYDYGHVDDTSTVFVGPVSTTTLELEDVDGHSVSGQLVGTVPLFAFTGLRATVRGGRLEARRSLDALEPGASDLDAYGALGELLLRDPRLGAFAVGGGFDRLEGEGGVTADQLTGSADLQIFFPDLGLGAVDWFSRFEFRHREVSGDGQAFDVDADVYHVTGGARWFAAPDVALVFAGTWQRVEEEFSSEDDQTGSLMVHGRLPLPLGPVSIELFAGASAGVSEYKESPFRGDRRLVYGARAGLTLRLFSGRSLIESMRQYD